MTDDFDFYDLLEIDEDADPEEVKSAFRTKVREYHPDLNDDPDAPAQFTAVKKAYEILKDASERQAYDRLGHKDYVAKRTSGIPDPSSWRTDDSSSGSASTSSGGRSSAAANGGASTTNSSSSSSRTSGSSRSSSSRSGSTRSDSSRSGSSRSGSSRSRSSRSDSSSESSSSSRSRSSGSSSQSSGSSSQSSGSSSRSSRSSSESGSSSRSSRSRSSSRSSGSSGSDDSTSSRSRSSSDSSGSSRSNRRATASSTASSRSSRSSGGSATPSGASAGGGGSASTDSTIGTRTGPKASSWTENPLFEWWRGLQLGWPLMLTSLLVFLAGVGYWVYANVGAFRSFASAVSAAGADTAALRSALYSRHGVPTLYGFVQSTEPVAVPAALTRLQWYGALAGVVAVTVLAFGVYRAVWADRPYKWVTMNETVGVGLAATVAATLYGGPLLAGAVVMPFVFLVIVRHTRAAYKFKPTYAYVLGVSAPAAALAAEYAVRSPPLALDLAGVALPVLSVLVLLFSAFVRPKLFG